METEQKPDEMSSLESVANGFADPSDRQADALKAYLLANGKSDQFKKQYENADPVYVVHSQFPTPEKTIVLLNKPSQSELPVNDCGKGMTLAELLDSVTYSPKSKNGKPADDFYRKSVKNNEYIEFRPNGREALVKALGKDIAFYSLPMHINGMKLACPVIITVSDADKPRTGYL